MRRTLQIDCRGLGDSEEIGKRPTLTLEDGTFGVGAGAVRITLCDHEGKRVAQFQIWPKDLDNALRHFLI